MPPVSTITSEERPKSSAFTVLNNVDSDLKTEDTTKELSTPLAKNVNIVKPLQREDYEAVKTQNSAAKEEMIERMAAPIGPQTILDPKFTRALDFKLRRLKEKEILQANLRRPTRNRTRIAASNPNISGLESTSPRKTMSQSHPRIDILVPELKISNKISPNFGKSPSPGQKSRKTPASIESCEKPRFITTVKTGQFLLPPPELACLLGLETLYPQADREKIVYSYSSRPKAVASRSKRSIAQEKLPQVHQNDINTHRVHAGNVFSGVRALVAGVVGMKQLVEHSHAHANGSINIPYSNLMHDKRVVRGSTFASHPHAAGDGIDSTAARAARTRRRALAKRAAAARLRPATPPPAPGRKHHPIQTEYYLEELFDKGQEMEIGVQTDLFVDRPATPVYVPAKTGADAFTQIYPGDLFDFDLEVQPILEVLIGKTTEQALAEVAQEEELATLREQQRRFVELRDAERAERERLAAQDMRLHQEKERRVSQARVAQVEAIEARERAAAAVLVQGYIAELLPSVLAGLKEQGYLMEKIERGVDEEFMPWLVQEVSNEIESIITSRDVITEIVRDVVEARAELYRASGDKEAEIPEVEDSVTEPSLPDEGEHEQEMQNQMDYNCNTFFQQDGVTSHVTNVSLAALLELFPDRVIVAEDT